MKGCGLKCSVNTKEMRMWLNRFWKFGQGKSLGQQIVFLLSCLYCLNDLNSIDSSLQIYKDILTNKNICSRNSNSFVSKYSCPKWHMHDLLEQFPCVGVTRYLDIFQGPNAKKAVISAANWIKNIYKKYLLEKGNLYKSAKIFCRNILR